MIVNSGRREEGFDAATRTSAFLRHAPYACLRATGSNALDLLHRLSTNDLRRLRVGQVARTILTTEKGRMIDLVTVAVLEDGLLLFVSRGNEHRLRRWIEKYTITEDISIDDLGRETQLACLVGPGSLQSASSLLQRSVPADGLAIVRERNVILTAVSSSARWGWEVYLLSAGEDGTADHYLEDRAAEAGIIGIARDVFDCARIARARPAFGAEISDGFTPHDVGLAEFVSQTKGCYIGQEVLARMVTYQKARKGLVGLTSALPLPRAEEQGLLFKNDVEVGVLTSSSPCAVYGRWLGLGIVRTDLVELGDLVAVGEPDADRSCRVAPVPIELPIS